MPVVVRSPARVGRERCSVCHDDAREELDLCQACGSLAHEDCHEALRRCPTIGCVGEFETRVDVPAESSSASFAAAFVSVWAGLGTAAACNDLVTGVALGAVVGLAFGASMVGVSRRGDWLLRAGGAAYLVFFALASFGFVLDEAERWGRSWQAVSCVVAREDRLDHWEDELADFSWLEGPEPMRAWSPYVAPPPDRIGVWRIDPQLPARRPLTWRELEAQRRRASTTSRRPGR